MAGRGTGKGKSAWETEAHLRSVQRLASYLQRAVETGRGIRTIMVQVDRYMCKRFSEESSDVIRLVRDLERRSSSANIRQVWGKVTPRLQEMSREFRSLSRIGYADLLDLRGRVEKEKVNLLIDLDSDVSLSLRKIRDSLEQVRSKKHSDDLSDEIVKMLEELTSTLKDRRRLVETSRLMKGH